ncbi:hypothetical protein PtrSN002B_007865 [Pyrenophora tritici-repentis]|nr:hypothetical protein PtrSN001C_007595 [Pyrenophora tritici-repentis]KAI1543421.1 hypothetical protein PtrSN002B_007865 [Pyrenophora tritici-repentis]KAI1565898.1 hypothetical protein PtrEW4_007966 [Pyrenophora tritici-repentis]KAI1598904.1 hypothetical protein PtrCC142_007803 [Pyrenophora tritici-repentis]PZC91611.1 Nop14 multi-domain protein [Pyrenophora tritici-repentis]
MQPKGLLRASVLLKGDDLRRFKDFQYWRSFGNPAVLDIADEYMTLPTAYEYYEFRSQHFDIHQAKNTGVAAQCRHPLHPGHPAVQPQQPEAEAGRDKRSPTEVAQWCPWKAVGGPWRDADSPPRTPARQEVMRAYTVRKTDFANELLRVEDISHLEQKWETANSSTTPSVEAAQIYSATHALAIYNTILKFPGMATSPASTSPITVPLPSPRQSPKKKTLSFSPDVPQETRNRHCAYFCRTYPPAYDRNSPHACPMADGWAETSFKNDLDYNIRQCRLLLCDRNPSSDEEEQVTYRELHDEASQDLLVALVEEWLENLESETKKLYWIKNLTATTDLFAVHKGEDVLGEELFSDWSRLEDEEGGEDYFDQESVAEDAGDGEVSEVEDGKVDEEEEWEDITLDEEESGDVKLEEQGESEDVMVEQQEEEKEEGESEDITVEEKSEDAMVEEESRDIMVEEQEYKTGTRKRKRAASVDLRSDPMDLDENDGDSTEVVGLFRG